MKHDLTKHCQRGLQFASLCEVTEGRSIKLLCQRPLDSGLRLYLPLAGVLAAFFSAASFFATAFVLCLASLGAAATGRGAVTGGVGLRVIVERLEIIMIKG